MISSSDYNTIMREYSELRRISMAERDARIEEIYAKIPRIRELDESRGAIAMQLVRRGENAGGVFLKIKKEKEDLLTAAGYPADYMEPRFACSDCRDTGYIDGSKCHCLRAREIRMLYAQSHIDSILEHENFSTLDASVYSDPEYMRNVVRYCKEYVRNFDAAENTDRENILFTGNTGAAHTTRQSREISRKNILFTGNTGVGKTFLCNCIAKELMEGNHSVIYLIAAELFDAMAKAQIKGDTGMKNLYDEALDCELLIIDDLGSELNNSLTNSNLFFVINHRMQRCLSTLISTNLNMKQIRDRYTERVSSRIMSSYQVIELLGADIRLRR